jgi:dsDNA-binding SOS-regulon protein
VSSLTEIEQAIATLPPEQFEELARWIAERREDAWDRQFEADVKAGRLDSAARQIEEDIANGRTRPLDEICRDQ